MSRNDGFTLLEVLIAMLVLAIALLGLAKLQAFSMKNTGNAYYKTQATLILNQAVEELRLNRQQTCAATASPAPEWLSKTLPSVSSALPGGVLTIGEDNESCINTTGLRCKITLAWTESLADLNGDGLINTNEAKYSQKSVSMSICR